MRSQNPPLSQLDLARRTGINSSTISRIMDGSRLPSREQVGMFCVGISENRAQRVELLVAWLRDEASAAAVAGIDERHYRLSAVSDAPDSLVAPSLASDLELIAAECVAQDDVRAVVSNLAHALARYRGVQHDAGKSSNVYQLRLNPEADYVAGPKVTTS